MGDATAIFSIHDKKDYEIHEIVQQVYDALKEKGYNPVNQLVGYILSEDPTYITTYKNALCVLSVLWIVNEIFNRKLMNTQGLGFILKKDFNGRRKNKKGKKVKK